MKIICTLLLLLLAIGLRANGQNTPPPGPVPPAMPVIERHRNPDYVEPNTEQPASRSAAERPKILDEYVIPVRPKQADTPTPYTESGIQFRVSPDGKWLVIGRQNGDINNGEQPLWRGPFGGPQMREPMLIIRH